MSEQQAEPVAIDQDILSEAVWGFLDALNPLGPKGTLAIRVHRTEFVAYARALLAHIEQRTEDNDVAWPLR